MWPDGKINFTIFESDLVSDVTTDDDDDDDDQCDQMARLILQYLAIYQI